jgi:hypothetical protein
MNQTPLLLLIVSCVALLYVCISYHPIRRILFVRQILLFEERRNTKNTKVARSTQRNFFVFFVTLHFNIEKLPSNNSTCTPIAIGAEQNYRMLQRPDSYRVTQQTMIVSNFVRYIIIQLNFKELIESKKFLRPKSPLHGDRGLQSPINRINSVLHQIRICF